MSPHIERVVIEESEILVTVRIPVDVDAYKPLDHLANEGKIQEAVRLMGHQATGTLYQHIADRDNETEGYENADGYWMRQEDQSIQSYGSPYDHIQIKRPYFYNDHTKTGDTPFERETRMDVHRLTPMTQYLMLRNLAEKGPQACAEALEEDYGLKLSHHLVDTFLEDLGKSYQDMKPELIQEALGRDWQPQWLPASLYDHKEEAPTQLVPPPSLKVNRCAGSPTISGGVCGDTHRRRRCACRPMRCDECHHPKIQCDGQG